MSGDCRVAAIEWTKIAEDRRNRIVAILGEMIRRRMAMRSQREAAYEWNLPEPEAEWTRQAR